MDATYTKAYEFFEKNHWWHVARGELIRKTLDRYVPTPSTARWLDVGCGAGVLLEEHQTIPHKVGVELDAGLVEAATAKGLDVRRIGPTWDFKSLGRFDVVTLCDVIEHVEDDRQALQAAADVMNPGALILVTVPAIKSLWSAHDVRNGHFRRYVKHELQSRFPANQWDILRTTYFSSFLFPAIWAYRQIKRARSGTDPAVAADDKKLGHPLVDGMLLKIFRTECRLVRRIPMPVGSSLLLVAKKI